MSLNIETCYVRHSYCNSRYSHYNYARPINTHTFEYTQKVSICTSSFQIGLHIQICKGKHPVAVKCAHILLSLVILVTSTNKSVRCDVRIMCEIGKNGKQYLNIVRVCLHFVQQKYMTIITTAIHTIIIITCTTYSIAVISFKSSVVSSSFGKFNVNSSG